MSESSLREKLKPFENKYYQSLEKDFTTRDGFRHSMGLNKPTTAHNWNPDPGIACGQGLHIVKGHPLFTHRFVSRLIPIYFEVTTIPNPPVPSSDGGGKCRAQTVVKIRRITKSEPEFTPALLADIVTSASHWFDCRAALDMLNVKVHCVFLADIAKNAYYWENRQLALNKLDAKNHSALLADIAKNASDWSVRLVAVKKLNAKNHSALLADIAKNASDLIVSRTAEQILLL